MNDKDNIVLKKLNLYLKIVDNGGFNLDLMFIGCSALWVLRKIIAKLYINEGVRKRIDVMNNKYIF